MILAPVIVGLAIASAFLAERSPSAARVLKMAASSATLALVFVLEPEPSRYLTLVVVALAASWIGDLSLSFDGPAPFVIGLVAFAGAHLAYIAAFAVRSHLDTATLVVVAPLMAVFALAVIRWLHPHSPQELKVPIVIYVIIISAMVTAAAGTHVARPDIRIPLAAVTFAASDLLVARQRFVAPSRWNPMVGLPLYFIAQVLFATTP